MSLTTFQLLYVIFIGATLGSFANVVIARLPEGESVVKPRSRCPQCKTTIRWYDNIPIVSYILLRGSCRHCQKTIALRYPLVEALTACLAAALYERLGWSYSLILWLPLMIALICLLFLDIDHYWLPDVITYPGMLWALVGAFFPGNFGALHAAFGMLPALFLWMVAWVFRALTHKDGLGFGDIKLLLLLGLAMGVENTFSVLLLGSLQGALVGITVQLAGGHQAKKPATATDDGFVPPPRAIPFGPFLILAAFEVLLLPDIFAHLPFKISQQLLS